MSGREHVGYRYLRWTRDVEPGLSANEKAQGYLAFAAEFESLPAHLEPCDGWAETMAYLCHRIARRRRGEPVGEWVPRWERQRYASTAHLPRARTGSAIPVAQSV